MENAMRVHAQDALHLRVLGYTVGIRCHDRAAMRLLSAIFGGMLTPLQERCDFTYDVQSHTEPSFLVRRDDGSLLKAGDAADLAFQLEKDLTIALQKKRADLLFLHAAAVAWQGQGFVIAAPSGTGKSTTTWALLHHGFQYLSDELAPIDLAKLVILPYPHALCLKQLPPAPYHLPASEPLTGWSIHVPTRMLPSAVLHESAPLSVLFVLQYAPGLPPQLREMGVAEASTRLYANALNLLAHRDQGLDAIVRVATGARCFMLRSGDLAATAALVRSAAEKIFGSVPAARHGPPVLATSGG